jgi:hypothetical protein
MVQPHSKFQFTEISLVVEHHNQVHAGDLLFQQKDDQIFVLMQIAPFNWSAALASDITISITKSMNAND